MAQFTSKLDKKGRVVIAPELLNALRIVPGTTLMLEVKDDNIVLQPIPQEPKLVEKDGVLVVRPLSAGDILDEVVKDRKERISNIIKDF